MSTQSVEQLVFGFIPQRDLVVQRHDGQITSDAGLPPNRQFDERWGYSRPMAAVAVHPEWPRDAAARAWNRRGIATA